MQIFANNTASTLSAGIADTDTSVVLVDATSFPDPGANFFLVTLDDGTNVEIIKCTAKATNTLTVVRAQEGTTARAWLAGARAEMRLTAGSISAKADVADAYVHPANHAPSVITQDASNRFVTDAEKAAWDAKGVGDVTLTGTQTLTNKTIHGNTNTLTADGTNAVGFRHIPQNDQTTTYTLVLTDAGKHVHKGGTTAFTVTIPANAAGGGVGAFPIGAALTFVNSAASGVLTIAITSDTMKLAGTGATGSRFLAAYGVATAIKVKSTEWVIFGTNLT